MFDNVPDGLLMSESDHMEPMRAEDRESNDVFVAYHLALGRKIQSRIISEFSQPILDRSRQPALDNLRSQFCQELEEWQASIPVGVPVDDKSGYGGRNWFRMVAYYSVLGLVSDLKDDIRQSVGAKAIIACCNACIAFRDIQKSRQIAQTWLSVGLIILLLICLLTSCVGPFTVSSRSNNFVLLLGHTI